MISSKSGYLALLPLLGVALCTDLAAASVPQGYEFLDYVEFTDKPNNGLPHMHLDQSQHNATQPPEGWHTLLILPDGKAYTKPIADSLAELESLPVQRLFPPSRNERIGERGSASRKLAQSGTTIGVSTANDLSCNGCGPDNRLQVSSTTSYPYMTIGQLIGQLGTSTVGLECTGTLIGNRHVVTAAHCVFDINASRKMVASLNFAPARNGNTAPYGTIQWSQARIVTQFSSQPSYTTTAMNYDFALVTLAQDATSGYLGLHLPPGNGATESATLNTAGYPGSKPSGTMWSSACGSTRIDYSTNNEFANVQQCANGGCSNILTHTCISSDGQSGSSMWDTSNDVRAILTGRVTTSNGEAYNVATEISTEVYNQLASWYNEDGDSAGNGTLPLAPSGPGSQPKQQNAFVKFWTQNWGKAWFIAVVVVIAVVAAGLLFLVFTCLLRCCCAPAAKPAKQPASRTSRPQPYGAQYAHQGAAPSSYSDQSPVGTQGAHYNPQSNQFLVNGRVYGTYVGQSPRGYSQHQSINPSAPPYR